MQIEISDKQGQQRNELTPVAFGELDIHIEEKKPEAESDWMLTADKLELWLQEIRNQPHWRLVADIEDDYYDGNQIDAETMEMLRERGQEPIVDNQIGPVIRTVLGMQAKTRTDPVVKPEPGETNSEVAEALNCKLKQYSNMVRSDRAKSDAYAEMMKIGVSWLGVTTNSDPFGAKFRYEHVHRREMWWDWRAKQPDYSDGRYVIRRKWVDVDQLIAAFPDLHEWIEGTMAGRAPWDMELMTSQVGNRALHDEYGAGFDVSVEQYEWMNVNRRRLLTYEIWYKVKVRDLVFKLPNGKVDEFDKSNHIHTMLLKAGLIKPYMAHFDRVRVGFWIGPKRAGDWASPYRHRHFPYVPMFCFRENRTGVPYGLIRCMISPQNEINARKTKMMWLLNSKWVEATEDAVDDHAVAADEVARPDGYVIVRNKAGERFVVHENQPMAAQQFQVMQEAKEALQTVAGVHNATLGRESGATSGLAINSLVEQDSITLAEPNDNFNMACRHADEIFLSLIIDDLSDSPNEQVEVEDDFGKKRIITLNQDGVDEVTGLPTRINDITKVNVAVVLGDTPQTPTFRNQQLNQLGEAMKSMPPQAQMALLPRWIMATDLPQRKEMADEIRKMLGQTEDSQDPEKAALQQKVQELEQKLAMKNPPELLAAQVAKLQAETDNIKATQTETLVKALYEAMQAAGVVVQNPAVVTVADSIAKSSGFVDQDGGDLVQDAGNGQQAFISGNQNAQTNQTLPQPPAQAVQPQQQQPMPAPAASPGQGVEQGIETQQLQG